MSDGFIIIDRRENPKSKSLSNRQRFINRSKQSIRQSAKKAMGDRSITDYGGAPVNVPTDGVEEPHFRHDPSSGEYEYVIPGNEEFIVGDRIKKQKNDSGGRGRDGGNGEGGEDDFEFILSYEEYVNIIFDDLELPDLSKTSEKNAVAFDNQRAGYTTSGIPSNLNVEKTAIAGMARRIALRAPKYRRIHELEEEFKGLNDQINAIEDGWMVDGVMDILRATEAQMTERERLIDRQAEISAEITVLRRRANAVSYLDDVDLRYNNFVKRPKPITQAVMFCMMDVSFSMGEREKIIAKKFFILLHLFLQRRYKNIDVVFVRHHTEATECDEETFFTSRAGGGTLVSSGYEKIKEIIAARYNSDDWNIYVAQASDGDNFSHDNDRVSEILSEDLLPVVQHLTYLEITDPTRAMFAMDFTPSSLLSTIEGVGETFDNFSCAQISDEREVIKVFRKLFKKETAE